MPMRSTSRRRIPSQYRDELIVDVLLGLAKRIGLFAQPLMIGEKLAGIEQRPKDVVHAFTQRDHVLDVFGTVR